MLGFRQNPLGLRLFFAVHVQLAGAIVTEAGAEAVAFSAAEAALLPSPAGTLRWMLLSKGSAGHETEITEAQAKPKPRHSSAKTSSHFPSACRSRDPVHANFQMLEPI